MLASTSKSNRQLSALTELQVRRISAGSLRSQIVFQSTLLACLHHGWLLSKVQSKGELQGKMLQSHRHKALKKKWCYSFLSLRLVSVLNEYLLIRILVPVVIQTHS